MKYMSNCNRCQAVINWPVPFVKGNKPLNPDGTPHFCKTGQTEQRSINEPERVNWESIPKDEQTEDMRELVLGLKAMRSLAYENTKELHPDMAENTNTFGQIVNANISHLINLAKVKAMKARSK